MRKINRIIIHVSYTFPEQDIGAAEIRRWHTSPDPGDPSKPWRDIGYHFVIPRNGKVEKGRPIEQAGAHVGGHNADSIGICIVGGKRHGRRNPCNFTRHQWRTLDKLVAELHIQFPQAELSGHDDHTTGKTCPQFDVKAWASV